MVPVVIAVAKQSKSPVVKKILNQYHKSIADQCFGKRCSKLIIVLRFIYFSYSNVVEESCCVLELLPVLIPGSKQGVKWGNYFFDVHEVSLINQCQ